MEKEKGKETPVEMQININEHFKIPIYYNDKKKLLKDSIARDLELVKTIDPSCNSMYSFLLNNDNAFSNKIVEQIAEFYTTDTSFLKDNQTLLKTYKNASECVEPINKSYEDIINIWKDIKLDAGFKERYCYIDWNNWNFLNKSENFLQFISIYNLASPVVSFFIPILILIVPFFIIKLRGLEINLHQYVEILKILISNNAIGKIFTHFNDVSLQEKIYMLVSAGLYVFSIYQNILTCIRFNENMIKIHEYLFVMKTYLERSTNNMNNYLKYSVNLSTHREFNSIVREKMNKLASLHDKIKKISKYEFKITKIFEIGFILKCFYDLHDDKEYEEAILYSFGFNGYTDCIEGLIENITDKKVAFAKFIKGKEKNIIKDNYYASLKNISHVKNTIKLKKNIIITGPNASGKTTILKSTLINIIFTQQFGCGFYRSACLKPYDNMHCYLNIPDTSGRDSLFQAEARRCKEIITAIIETPKETHFCAFDELYSGTNPTEAEISAIAFMEYLVKNKYLSCMLTTHYIGVCKKLNSNKSIINCKMESIKESGGKIHYKYLLKEGISEVKGGLNVLLDMEYPDEIINNTMEKQIVLK